MVSALCWGRIGGAAASAAGVLLNIVLRLSRGGGASIPSEAIQGVVLYTFTGLAVGFPRDALHRLLDAREASGLSKGLLLPICMRCKSIRDDGGQWHRTEAFLKQCTGRDLTHGLCPACEKEAYAAYVDKVKDTR
jgi:hypothetical protein